MKDQPAFSVKISRSITEIEKGQWTDVYPPIPESYGFLKTVEETLQPQFKFYYISIYDGERLFSVAPCFLLEYPLDTTLGGPLKTAASLLRRIAPRLLTVRAVTCGSPACEGRIGIKDPSLRHAAAKMIADAMRSIAKKENASVIAFKEFSDDYETLLKPLARMGFHRARTLPSAALDISFRSFDEYFSTLSRKTKIDLKRKFKKSEGRVKIEMQVMDRPGELLDDIYRLYLGTLNKSDMRFEIMTKDFFEKISKNMPDEARFFVWRIDGRPVAFNLCLVSGDVFVAEYIGFDYAVAYEYHLYFVVFRDELKWCIRNGIRRYETGAMNYDPKKRLGLRFVPQYVYARHESGVVNPFFGFLMRILEPENYDDVLKTMRERDNHIAASISDSRERATLEAGSISRAFLQQTRESSTLPIL